MLPRTSYINIISPRDQFTSGHCIVFSTLPYAFLYIFHPTLTLLRWPTFRSCNSSLWPLFFQVFFFFNAWALLWRSCFAWREVTGKLALFPPFLGRWKKRSHVRVAPCRSKRAVPRLYRFPAVYQRGLRGEMYEHLWQLRLLRSVLQARAHQRPYILRMLLLLLSAWARASRSYFRADSLARCPHDKGESNVSPLEFLSFDQVIYGLRSMFLSLDFTFNISMINPWRRMTAIRDFCHS